MPGLRFGPTFTFPTSGLLTDLAMLHYSWKGEWLVGVLEMLREFEYSVCSFICLFNSRLTYTAGIHAWELRNPRTRR